MGRTERRVRSVVEPRLEPGETFVAWTPAWVSRQQRLHRVLAARTRDFAVVTDRRIMLWSTGFFTRRPRRRVLAERLDECTITVGRGGLRRVSVRKPAQRALLLEFGRRDPADAFTRALRERYGDAPNEALPPESEPVTASESEVVE
jgi:hypothetical protein